MLSVLRHIAVGGRVLKRFWKDEEAVAGTEYALLLFVVLLGMALAIYTLGDAIAGAITAMAEMLRDGPVPPAKCCD